MRKQKATRVLLELRKLSAGYGRLQVLKEVSLTLAPGDLAVIIGPNGSGKSTTVKSVFHLTDILRGAVLFDGEELTMLPTHECVRRGIGYVPQGRLVFESLTVRENLLMGGFGLDAATLAERLASVLKLFPQLNPFLARQASFLSGGQQQMLSIGRALMRRPKLLLLDEPSLGLDPKTQRLIFRTIKQINKEGTTIMMVEQNAKQALALCSKAYVIENGRVVASGGPDLAKRKKIQELYLGG